MKLNLSKKQMIFALLYSSLLPIFFYNDMQISINNATLGSSCTKKVSISTNS